MELTRRSMLVSGAGVVATSPLAGCLSEPGGGETGGSSGYAAFFALWDWAERVGGDGFEFDNPVDVGEIGHGWEPDGGLTREIAGSDAFVYLDTPEFAWAQDIARQLESDYDDVSVIDGMQGLEDELIPWDGEGSEEDDLPEPDTDHEFDPAETAVAELDVVDLRTGEVAAYWHGDHWHGGLPEVPLDGSVPLGAVFEDTEGRVLPLGDDEPFQFDATVLEGAQEIVEIESHGDEVELIGVEEGRTQVVFELIGDDEVIFDTSEDGLAVEVVEEPEEDDEDADDEGFYDPHVWVDPVLAQEIVSTIADGLGEIDPDGAETYEENAAAYNEEIAEVHRGFEELVADADHEVAVLAGHDSFQYVEQRYGFDLHTPVGVSPDEEPSQSDIADTIEFVDEHGIDVVLYDYFESPNLAETIVENSDASEIEGVSPAEGSVEEWNERGWGWVEQMEEINLPAFRKALGAE